MQGKCIFCKGYITGKKNPKQSRITHNGCKARHHV